jgi:hypothetical protein
LGNSKGILATVALFGNFLGVVFLFIDGMLLWSIAFFVLGIGLIILMIMWDIAGWADNVARKIGED